MKFKHLFIVLFSIFIHQQLSAQVFSDHFENKTLRVDYIFSGNNLNQSIYLDELISLPGWAGRTTRLNEIPLEGNGQLIVLNPASGDTLYMTSFSSLFQEWVTTDEAKDKSKAFENTFLVPFPKKPVDIEISLNNPSKEKVAVYKHHVDPDDILIHKKGEKHITSHKYIHGDSTYRDRIDLAILGEGYTAEETELFFADAKRAYDAIFYYEPFDALKDRFNVVAVMAPSKDSGVSVPNKGDWKDTAFGSNFDTFYSPRYLTTSRVKSIHNALAGIPYEHIVILANTDVYGGGGIYNSYTLTTAHHENFKPVVAHEFGHSFGGLGDEYFYDDDMMENFYVFNVEPWEQNITTLVNFKDKWEDMLPANIPVPTLPEQENLYPVGVYEGGGYVSKGVYRPANDCRMRTNNAPEFCQVCQRALQRIIDFYTDN